MAPLTMWLGSASVTHAAPSLSAVYHPAWESAHMYISTFRGDGSDAKDKLLPFSTQIAIQPCLSPFLVCWPPRALSDRLTQLHIS